MTDKKDINAFVDSIINPKHVTPCGLFIYLDHLNVAASPDGLVGF